MQMEAENCEQYRVETTTKKTGKRCGGRSKNILIWLHEQIMHIPKSVSTIQYQHKPTVTEAWLLLGQGPDRFPVMWCLQFCWWEVKARRTGRGEDTQLHCFPGCNLGRKLNLRLWKHPILWPLTVLDKDFVSVMYMVKSSF